MKEAGMLRITQPPAYICHKGHTVSHHPADQQPSTIAYSWSQHPTHFFLKCDTQEVSRTKLNPERPDHKCSCLKAAAGPPSLRPLIALICAQRGPSNELSS